MEIGEVSGNDFFTHQQIQVVKTKLETKIIYWEEIGVRVELSFFHPSDSDGMEEIHAMLHIDSCGDSFIVQLDRIVQAEENLKQLGDMSGSKAVFRRVFLSDVTNQMPLVMERYASQVTDAVESDCDCAALSVIQQPPLDGTKIAVWIYLQKGGILYIKNGMNVVEHNGYRHIYNMNLCKPDGDSYAQTMTLLREYEDGLGKFDATIKDNCIRTWFFVRDVDTRYAGLVQARRENFAEQGLTKDTHYIASTGIGGSPADPHAIVQLDAYAMSGFEPQQMSYLHAYTHLNPTIEYGVTFERGTTMEYGDRAHVLISGTASINNRGQVEHVGDIIGQTKRMWENVETLLAEADASFNDVMQIIVYLRDMSDYPVVKQMFDEKLPSVPRVITLAPVCRPAWLIEMECIAIPRRENPQYRNC